MFFSDFSHGITHMWHSQILASWNFSSNLDFVPWIGEKLDIGAKFQQFSRFNKYIRVPGKLSEIHFKVRFFSNPGDKVQKCKIQGDKSVPYFNKKTNIVLWIGEQWDFAMYFWQFSMHPDTLVVPANCWNSAPMFSFSPIQGTMSRLLLKLHVARIWEWKIWKIMGTPICS